MINFSMVSHIERKKIEKGMGGMSSAVRCDEGKGNDCLVYDTIMMDYALV